MVCLERPLKENLLVCGQKQERAVYLRDFSSQRNSKRPGLATGISESTHSRKREGRCLNQELTGGTVCSADMSVKTRVVGEITLGRIICQAGRSPALADSEELVPAKRRGKEQAETREAKEEPWPRRSPGRKCSCVRKSPVQTQDTVAYAWNPSTRLGKMDGKVQRWEKCISSEV